QRHTGDCGDKSCEQFLAFHLCSSLNRVFLQALILKSLCPFSHVSLRNTLGLVCCLSTVSVSLATHLPRMRAAGGLLFWLVPPPCPSRQEQSLPKTSLF